jgi:myo-inositol-1-phosphate synthase
VLKHFHAAQNIVIDESTPSLHIAAKIFFATLPLDIGTTFVNKMPPLALRRRYDLQKSEYLSAVWLKCRLAFLEGRLS